MTRASRITSQKFRRNSGVEFLMFEVEFRILVPQTYMENMKNVFIFRGCESELKTKKMRAEIPYPVVCFTFSYDRSLRGKHQKYWNVVLCLNVKNSYVWRSYKAGVGLKRCVWMCSTVLYLQNLFTIFLRGRSWKYWNSVFQCFVENSPC